MGVAWCSATESTSGLPVLVCCEVRLRVQALGGEPSRAEPRRGEPRKRSGRRAGRRVVTLMKRPHMHMHTCTHAHMHTCAHAHMRTCAHAHMHTCTP